MSFLVRTPTQIRIEFLDIARETRSFGAEILLKHDAVMVDHESHDSGIAVFGLGNYQIPLSGVVIS
jgi:hypothetical protein